MTVQEKVNDKVLDVSSETTTLLFLIILDNFREETELSLNRRRFHFYPFNIFNTFNTASIYLQSRTAAPAEKEKGEKRTVFQLFNSVCVKVYNSFVQKSRFHKDLSFSSSSLLQFLPYFSNKSTADSIFQNLKYNRTETEPRCIRNIKLQRTRNITIQWTIWCMMLTTSWLKQGKHGFHYALIWFNTT